MGIRTIYVASDGDNGDISFEAIMHNESEEGKIHGGGLLGTSGWMVANESSADQIESMIDHAPGLEVTGREKH